MMRHLVLECIVGSDNYPVFNGSIFGYTTAAVTVLVFFFFCWNRVLQGASLSGDDGASKKSDAPPSRGPSFGRVDSSRLTLEATASNLKVM